MKKQEKYLHYAAMLSGALADIFEEDSDSDFHIDLNELKEEDNLTQFFHALSNTMPTMVFNKITGSDKNILEFNHIANQLVFQFSQKKEK